MDLMQIRQKLRYEIEDRRQEIQEENDLDELKSLNDELIELHESLGKIKALEQLERGKTRKSIAGEIYAAVNPYYVPQDANSEDLEDTLGSIEDLLKRLDEQELEIKRRRAEARHVSW